MLTDNGGQQALIPEGELIDFEPAWFRAAVAEAGTSHFVPYAGADLHYLEWAYKGTDSAPLTLVLLHGDGAHAHWFDFIAPLLTPYYRVIAADLAGMGDSGWLTTYSREIMAEAMATILAAVHKTSATQKPPALIAHSFGAMVGLHIAHHHPKTLSALMICDFHTRPANEHHEWYADYVAQPSRIYPDPETIMARFRLRPEQPCANQYILDHIAKNSIKPKDDGWTWKFDPSIYEGFEIGTGIESIYKGLRLPLASMFGAKANDFETMTRLEMVAHMRNLRPDVVHYDIVGAHHHLMLDQPHAFASACAAQMEAWRAQKVFD